MDESARLLGIEKALHMAWRRAQKLQKATLLLPDYVYQLKCLAGQAEYVARETCKLLGMVGE